MATVDTEQAARVRRMLGQTRGKDGRRVFPKEARKAAARFAQQGKRLGIPFSATARALDVDDITLANWRQTYSHDSSDSFVPLVRKEQVEVLSEATTLVLEHPSGVRVHGLTLSQIAPLLRSLL